MLHKLEPRARAAVAICLGLLAVGTVLGIVWLGMYRPG